YEIAKKLGIESKEVLAKAKDLGITGAKVPSSSLDKITAEYLESHFQPAAPKLESVVAAPEPVTIISAPVEPPPPEPVTFETPAAPIDVRAKLPASPGIEPPSDEPAAPPVSPETEAEPVAAATTDLQTEMEPATADESTSPPPAAPSMPAVPPPPQIGDKVGFIQLPSRPVARQPERPRGPQRGMTPAPPSRPDLSRSGGRPDPRGGQSRVPMAPGRPGQPAGRGPQQSSGPAQPGRPAGPQLPTYTAPADAQVITLKPPIIVRELAEKLGKKPFQLIADLIELKVMANVNQAIDEAIAQRLCAKHGFRFEAEKRERGGGIVHAPKKTVELDIEDKPEELKPRAPVVTIMGHVDHGKTTLLDAIRKSDVAAGEAGGITQHIGAYTIAIPHPERKEELAQITFLDTPGHAAFSAMRARGANVTDIVVLVVAANDGVMPQTLEALSHAQAAKVPIIVAVNKSDHPAANAMKVRQQLQERGLVPDDWGGNTVFCEVSALTKDGVPHLLEMILLQAELIELKANPTRRAKGNVIESGLAPGGPTATVLVRKGTLKVGDVMICGPFYGKVRALINEENKRLKEAGPSVAVKVLGLNGVPEAGLEFSVLEDEKAARELAGQRLEEAKELAKEARAKITLENLFETLAEHQAKVLKTVVKADTQGSVEAICDALRKIESEQVALEIIHSAVGTITESDVLLASASKGIILGFHTRVEGGVSDVAKREGVQIKLYSIIYELIDQVKEAMAGLLEPILKEVVIGAAEVKKVFELSKGGSVAGCVISSGRIGRGKVRVTRRKNLIYEGATQSLRRFQDEVNEVRAGMECGIRIDGFNDFQVGDVIESFTVEKLAPKL
ncbi:MAG TPA: translation initiation factor IF-2, partial [Verrucomicrobiae bacterium]|nr:translation initiation factor IF-2 [Verrucomicrobiae bacterium]